jgi:putative ABC transport system ATP-binding protein
MSSNTATAAEAVAAGSANGVIVQAIKVRKTYLRGKEELAVLQDLDLNDRPTSGQILVAGVDVGALPERSRAKWRAANIGFIFQTYNMMPVLTALENVELPLLLASLSSKERRERAKTALSVVGLSERMQHYPRELSGGQEQRVAIARAIVTDPRLIVADEPTGDLDRKSADDVLKLLERLNTEFNKTIIMVTHDPAAAERAKKVHHLDKGQLT